MIKRKGVKKKRAAARAPVSKVPPAKVVKAPWSLKNHDSPVALAVLHVDSLLERISKGKLKAFDPASLTQLQKLSEPELKELDKHYTTTVKGIVAAIAGSAFEVEAYSNFSKAALRVANEYLKQLRKVKPDAKVGGKKIRLGNHAPRKKKAKEPVKVVQKVLYLESDPGTGLSSVPPSELVGASEVWIYNVKTRKLGCYYASSKAGLNVKGTTMMNYDEKKSTVKNMRYPKRQVPQFMQGGIEWMRGYWNAIKSTPLQITPRLNRHTLILKAHRRQSTTA